MRDVALGVVKQLGGRACTMVQDAFIRKVAPATIGIEHARLLLETCVAGFGRLAGFLLAL